MGSWIRLFSKFTPEALLFELLFIFVLLGGYAAFWILRKRRYGSVENVVPAGVVRAYLNELINDAERLRAQLFGLLAGAGLQPGEAAKLAGILSAQRGMPGLSIAAEPEMAAKLATLEGKMADQARSVETLTMEKSRLTQELQSARSGAGGSGGGNPDAISKLEEKIRNLEAKLEEYSVIEDDLANLKRLQQENAQLRAALAECGISAPAAPAKAAAPAAVVATPAPVPAPDPVPVSDPVPIPEPMASPEPVLAAAEAGAMPDPVPAAPEPVFDQLVTEVEKSLEPTPAEPAVAEPEPKLEEVAAAPAAPPAAEPAAASGDKSDADLVAEFEKMLNG